jgi:hypothetical protein
MLRKIFGTGGLALAALGFFFKEAIAGLIGSLSEKILHPDVWDGGQFMTFNFADILILLILFTSVILLIWPWLSKKMQTDIERKSLQTTSTKRRVFNDLSFQSEDESAFLSNEFKPVFVDCTFSPDRLGLSDCLFDDGFRLEPIKVTLCSYEELAKLSASVPTLTRARLINTPIYSEHIFLTEAAANELFAGSPIKGLVDLDKSLLVTTNPEWRNLLRLSRVKSKTR